MNTGQSPSFGGIVGMMMAESESLPPIAALGYEYVLAGNGLFVRAEDSRMEACIPVALVPLHGLAELAPFARLKAPLVPATFLLAILRSARVQLPNEAMYQLTHHDAPDDGRTRRGWRCHMPGQVMSAASLSFEDCGDAVVDLHSHNSMEAFFSTVDDGDEQGLRFYVVIGRLDTAQPEIAARAGVYGHHWPVPATAVFESLGPFQDVYGREDTEARCRVCGCTDLNGCEEGCYWVEPGLCSRCAPATSAQE